MSDTNDSPMNAWRKMKQEQKSGIKRKKKSVYTKKELNRPYKNVRTLQPIPDDQRDKKMEQILGDKLYKLSEIFKKVGDDITKKGYLSKDIEIQQVCIRGADAFIEYLAPLFHDNFYGDWTDKFDPFVVRVMAEREWYEEPEFIRNYRYELDLETGAVKDRYEYTHSYIIGPKIVPSIVSVIKIAHNIQFFGALFKNNRQMRYKQQLSRDAKRFDNTY